MAFLSWNGFLQQLRELDKLLSKTYMREQFTALCVKDPTDATYFSSWGASLKGLRWEVLAKFTSEVHLRRFKVSSDLFKSRKAIALALVGSIS